jgi:hypothetical protein
MVDAQHQCTLRYGMADTAKASDEENARLVIHFVQERDMDGYTLMSKSGLSLDALQGAVRYLLAMGRLRVKGETQGPRLAESWFQAIPCGAQARMSGMM